MNKSKNFGSIIIGGGNAGIEAANISANLRIKTLLITNNIENLGTLSCNPSIGGIGKSQIVNEINELGGLMGKLADKSGIQFKILNTSKGEAVRSLRVQINRIKYKKFVKYNLNKNKNLYILQETVKKLIIKNNKIKGVITNEKNKYLSKTVILTTGTFLNGIIYIGLNKYKGGRLNDKTNNYLAKQLKEFNFYGGRLKTGTPPRIYGKYINFNKLKKQNGDKNPIPFFSELKKNFKKPQISCWLTKTNKKTHEIIKNNLKYSAIYKNLINGIGPRYCPSIEDKIYRFYNKDSHQIFLEPEDEKNQMFYPSGLSMSLPIKLQNKILNSIKGLEKTYIIKPGYSVEYDFFDPKNLKITLESKFISNLYFAGQINGTTGYEEAACQGLIAGLNSSLYINNKSNWYPNKEFSYIAILINDLINSGITEPYRIFTSKSNNKLYLRNDNTELRLLNIKLNKKKLIINNYKKYIIKNLFFNFFKNNKLTINKTKYLDLIKKKYNIIINKIIIKSINIYYKYRNYIKKHKKHKKNFCNTKLPKHINYFKIKNLSNEIKEKLNKIKPKNFSDLLNLKWLSKENINLIKINISKI